MTPKVAPWLWLSLSVAVVVSFLLLLFGSGSHLHIAAFDKIALNVLNFLRKLTVHYAIEWVICAVAFGAILVQSVWEKFGSQTA